MMKIGLFQHGYSNFASTWEQNSQGLPLRTPWRSGAYIVRTGVEFGGRCGWQAEVQSSMIRRQLHRFNGRMRFLVGTADERAVEQLSDAAVWLTYMTAHSVSRS